MIRPAQHVLLGQGRAAEPYDPPENVTFGEYIISEGASLNLPRPSGDGIYYAFIVHRSHLTVPDGWALLERAETRYEELDIDQWLSLLRAESSVETAEFIQDSSSRFLGQIVCVQGGGSYIETITKLDFQSASGWHAGPSLTPQGNGFVLSCECSVLANNPVNDYLSTLRRTANQRDVDNRLCLSYGDTISGITVDPRFHLESDGNPVCGISISITDKAAAPDQIFTQPMIIQEEFRGGAGGNIGVPAGGSYSAYIDFGFGSFDFADTLSVGSPKYISDSLPRPAIDHDVKVYGECPVVDFGNRAANRSFKGITQFGDIDIDFLSLIGTDTSWPVLQEIFDLLPFSEGERTLEITGIPALDDPDYDPQPAIDKGWTVIDS